jgi:NTP pyrophosphatase (non-canonical NTP hydrolase)
VVQKNLRATFRFNGSKKRNKNMTLNNLQQNIDTYITTTGVRYFNHLTNLGILMEEVGELSRLMVRKYGEQSTKPSENNKEIADEMADILWVLGALANQCDVNLTDAVQKNMDKKNTRDATRHLNNDKLK